MQFYMEWRSASGLFPKKKNEGPDNLELYHWVRVVNGVPPTDDYPFAKYNKSVDVFKYTDEEYQKYLTDPKWTKEETDLMFDLCERFDLCFVVIADRFPSPRSVEELKDRYYTISRAMLAARAPSPSDVSGHPLVKELDDPLIIIYEKKISSDSAIVKALELALKRQRPLLIVAEAKTRAGIKVCAVKAPGFGENRKAGLQDLATLIGGEVITEELGMNMEKVEFEVTIQG